MKKVIIITCVVLLGLTLALVTLFVTKQGTPVENGVDVSDDASSESLSSYAGEDGYEFEFMERFYYDHSKDYEFVLYVGKDVDESDLDFVVNFQNERLELQHVNILDTYPVGNRKAVVVQLVANELFKKGMYEISLYVKEEKVLTGEFPVMESTSEA